MANILQPQFSNVGVIFPLRTKLAMSTLLFDFVRWKEVMIFFWKYVMQYFGIVFYLLILTSLLYVGRVRKHLFLSLLILLSIILFIIAIYGFSLTHSWWKTAGGADSTRRLFMILLPIVWYFIALMTAEPDFLKEKVSVKLHRSA